MQDVLCPVKSEYPNVTKAYFRQDITGCSHSLPTILACPAVSGSTGVQIRRIDFSNPQGRKGATDCLPATCKAHVRIFINEGHDVTNATQLKDTLVSHGGIDGVRVVCLDAITMASPISEIAKIQNISKLNNFEFTEGAPDMRRAQGLNGERLFKSTAFLTPQQISSYFSCLSCQQTLTHEAYLTAIEDEIHFSTARDQVMATVTLQHPIVFDLYNICAMAEEDTLKNLKVSLLQVICQGLNLDIPINQFAIKLHT
ncbi:unnamed protein product [Porites evermanni]|uniref:Uncharacterized protein n=1 Tax=Porites evermanni TaxID=104178 RepID=A0ABN8RZ90_9CNID|nr:unnamed protein product [Porites evermanni]